MRHITAINKYTLKLLLGLTCLSTVVGCENGYEGDEEGAEGSYDSETTMERVQITKVELGRDLDNEPAYLNERIPITLGVIATGTQDGEPIEEGVPLVVSFVDPADPDTGCASNGMLLELVGDGEEREYNGFIWPPTNCGDLVGGDVTLKIEVDPAAENQIIDPLILSQDQASEPANAACNGPESGCVKEFQLEMAAESGADVEFAGFNSESSVGVIPPFTLDVPEPEAAQPILVAQNLLVFNGRDPYESPVPADEIPQELLDEDPEIAEQLQFGRDADAIQTIDDLPAPLHLSYEISATSDGETWLPLTIGDEEGNLDEAVITELLPGTANAVTHEVFLEGEALDAVIDPDQWLGEESFTVRSCFTTDFTQFRATDDEAKCRTTEIMLVPENEVEGGASTFNFKKQYAKDFGNSRVKLESFFGTENLIDSDGVYSDTEGRLTVKGKIGKSYSLDLIKAHATVDAPLSSERSVDMGLRIFNNDVYGYTDDGPDLTISEGVAFSRNQTIVKAKFMFGPVPVKFDLSAGGSIGIDFEGSASFFGTDAGCRPLLPLADAQVIEQEQAKLQKIEALEARAELMPDFFKAFFQKLINSAKKGLSDNPFDPGTPVRGCVDLNGTVTPTANLSASAFGGVSIVIASAGVQIDLILAKLDLPLNTNLVLGLNESNELVTYASTRLDLDFLPVKGALKLVGKLKLGFFKKSKSVTIVKFQSKTIKTKLLKRDTAASRLLTF